MADRPNPPTIPADTPDVVQLCTPLVNTKNGRQGVALGEPEWGQVLVCYVTGETRELVEELSESMAVPMDRLTARAHVAAALQRKSGQPDEGGARVRFWPTNRGRILAIDGPRGSVLATSWEERDRWHVPELAGLTTVPEALAAVAVAVLGGEVSNAS